MLTETTHTHKPAHKHTDRAAVHTVSQKWFENWKLTKSERKKRWHKFSWKSKQKKNLSGRVGWACVHFPCCCCCSCSMRISVATRHFVLAKIWAMAEKRRRAEHQWRSEWQPAIADSREELALFFRVQWAFPLSTAQFPCQFSTRFWMLNVSLGCLRVSACNSASCKNMQIRHQKCFNENSACGKKKKKRMKHCLQKALAHFRHN